MGYTTYFTGQINVRPPLNKDEIDYLKKFSETRRMKCVEGPYFVDRGGFMGQEVDSNVIKSGGPPDGQPGLWCQWISNDDGTAIIWDGNEKFYDSVEWMQYLIDHFIGYDPAAREELPFLEGHELNGITEAIGEEPSDYWFLVVKDNEIF